MSSETVNIVEASNFFNCPCGIPPTPSPWPLFVSDALPTAEPNPGGSCSKTRDSSRDPNNDDVSSKRAIAVIAYSCAACGSSSRLANAF